MSHKKKKKRLDKKLIEQRLRELETEAKENKPNQIAETKTQAVSKKHKIPEATPVKELNSSDLLIIKDLKKLILVAAIVILIFAALFAINLKTNYILIASDKILSILHVGQL